MTPRRKALLLYLAVLGTAPFVVLIGLVGVLASAETLEWELQWADKMLAVAVFAVTAWLVLVAVAVRFGVATARRTRSERFQAGQLRGTGR